MAARDISYGADGVLLLCESLLQHLLVSEPDAGVIVYGSAYLRVLCKHYSCTFARPRVALALSLLPLALPAVDELWTGL